MLLEEQARRFMLPNIVPHLEKWHEQGMYPREVWTKAGAAGLLCAGDAGGVWRRRRHVRA